MENFINCPDCHSTEIIKNGSIGNGKPKYKCKHCGRQFVLNPQKHPISAETKALIDRFEEKEFHWPVLRGLLKFLH